MKVNVAPGCGRLTRVNFTLLATIAALVTLVSCSGDHPHQAPVTVSSVESVACPALTPRPRPTLALPIKPKVLIFGDSYTEGYGADPLTAGYAYKVGRPLGWDVTVDGVGSTGYVNPGNVNQGTYLTRLSHAPHRQFDLVVLQGSSNDVEPPLVLLTDAIDTMVRAVRKKYPSAQVLMMGPAAPYGSFNVGRAQVNAILAKFANDHRLVFFNPMCEKWFAKGDGARFVNLANGHPNNAGYSQIAQLFERDVRQDSIP